MKLIVFGSTGRVGISILRLCIESEDWQVTAFARTPSKIPEDLRSKVNVVVGSLLKPEDVSSAMAGQDAVISCVGPPSFSFFTPTTVVTECTRNIVDAMREHSVKKLAVIGGVHLLPGQTAPFFIKNALKDHQNGLDILRKAKDIQWAMLAPSVIENLPEGGKYEVAINKQPGSFVARTFDIADWMLSYLKNDENTEEFCHQMVGISSTVSTFQFLSQTRPGKLILKVAAGVSVAVALACCYFL